MHVHGAVHRFHRGMREKWHLVHSVDAMRCASEGMFSIALVSRHGSRVLRRVFELTDNGSHIDGRIRSVIPLNSSSLESFPGGPHVIGDDGDGLVDVDDLTHAPYGQGRSFVHEFRPSAKHG